MPRVAVAPSGVSQPQEWITDPLERLIRRFRLNKAKFIVVDQITGKRRPPAAAFEPRLPENRPNATRHDKYLSVNVVSSLTNAGLPADWGLDRTQFVAAQLNVDACHSVGFHVTWEPVLGQSNPAHDNPHHGGIQGAVELYRSDMDSFEVAISKLAKASEVIP